MAKVKAKKVKKNTLAENRSGINGPLFSTRSSQVVDASTGPLTASRPHTAVQQNHTRSRLFDQQLRNAILIEYIYNHINGNNNNHNGQRNVIYYLSCFLMVHLIDIEY